MSTGLMPTLTWTCSASVVANFSFALMLVPFTLAALLQGIV